MGLYIRPAEKVEQEGRSIRLGDSLLQLRGQLQNGEEAVAVAKRQHGKVALLITGEGDFRAVSHSGCDGLYAVSKEIAATAC